MQCRSCCGVSMAPEHKIRTLYNGNGAIKWHVCDECKLASTSEDAMRRLKCESPFKNLPDPEPPKPTERNEDDRPDYI